MTKVGKMKHEIRIQSGLTQSDIANRRITSCSYGVSQVAFRGPRKNCEGRYVACLGGSETFGRYVPRPFPDLLETALGEVCVNLGCQNAGTDLFLRDSATLALAHDAAACVVHLTGAQNQTNRYYRVHPRRNDRFLGPTDALRDLYPEVDFTEIAFTRHLGGVLYRIDPDRFDKVRQELQRVWIRRMKQLLAGITGPVLLLWFADHPPRPEGAVQDIEELREDPALITRAMLDKLRPHVAGLLELCPSEKALEQGTEGMVFAPLDLPAAKSALNVAAHAEAARALTAPLRAMLKRN